MNVLELIEKLQKIEDKSKTVVIANPGDSVFDYDGRYAGKCLETADNKAVIIFGEDNFWR